MVALFHNWSAAVDACKFFRRVRQGRKGSGVALSVSISILLSLGLGMEKGSRKNGCSSRRKY